MNPLIKTAGIIGTGLIGGSMACHLKAKQLAANILGYDVLAANAEKALALNLIDATCSLEELLDKANFIILAIPVNHAASILPIVLPQLAPHQTLIDVGSTKTTICNIANTLPNRDRFVATHPMWGTEFKGPTAAKLDSFNGRAAVICEVASSATDAVQITQLFYQALGMHWVSMTAEEHDMHVAYISHVSHITSFALANTVLEKEKEAATIFELASGGFESTVRLAKSNPAMWLPIFQQNREHVLDVLNEHIHQLKKFKSCLEKENWEYMQSLIEQANTIKKIIK
jgi:prephenate dehydrogenase